MRAAHLKDIQPLQDQMLSKSRELRSLWLAATPDKEKILALQKETRDLRDQLTDKRTAYRLEVQKVLTPEQQAKVQAYGTGRGMGRMGGGSGMMGGAPAGECGNIMTNGRTSPDESAGSPTENGKGVAGMSLADINSGLAGD